MEDVKTATGTCAPDTAVWRMLLIGWLQLQRLFATIMHGMKIDVKRKIYLVIIEKIDNKGNIIQNSGFCRRLLSALQKISSTIRQLK